LSIFECLYEYALGAHVIDDRREDNVVIASKVLGEAHQISGFESHVQLSQHGRTELIDSVSNAHPFGSGKKIDDATSQGHNGEIDLDVGSYVGVKNLDGDFFTSKFDLGTVNLGDGTSSDGDGIELVKEFINFVVVAFADEMFSLIKRVRGAVVLKFIEVGKHVRRENIRAGGGPLTKFNPTATGHVYGIVKQVPPKRTKWRYNSGPNAQKD